MFESWRYHSIGICFPGTNNRQHILPASRQPSSMLGRISYKLVSTNCNAIFDFLGYFQLFKLIFYIHFWFFWVFLIFLYFKNNKFMEGFGIPALGFYTLYRNRFQLESLENSSKYSFLYEGYKNDKYYWEFVILSRKILIIICSVFMTTSGPEIQVKNYKFYDVIFVFFNILQ